MRIGKKAWCAGVLLLIILTACSPGAPNDMPTPERSSHEPTVVGPGGQPPTATTDGQTPPFRSPTASEKPSPTARPSSPPTPPPDFTHAPEPTAKAYKQHKSVAQAFGRAYTNTKGGEKAWLRRVKPLVSARLFKEMKGDGPKSVPRGKWSVRCDPVVGESEVKCALEYKTASRVIWLDWARGRWTVGALATPGEPI